MRVGLWCLRRRKLVFGPLTHKIFGYFLILRRVGWNVRFWFSRIPTNALQMHPCQEQSSPSRIGIVYKGFAFDLLAF